MFVEIDEKALETYGVGAAGDVLSGTAQANKQVFDRMAKEVLIPAFNALVEALGKEDAPEHIGAIGGTLQKVLDKKVEKEDGKMLSDNNYSDEDKAKLDGLAGNFETVLDNIISIQNTLIGGDA